MSALTVIHTETRLPIVGWIVIPFILGYRLLLPSY